MYSIWGLPLKVCYFYFLFFREDISVTNKVDGEQRWWTRLEQHLSFADVFFGCLSFFPIMFLLPKDSL